MTSKNHTLVLSDVHLCRLISDDAPWMRYRQSAYLQDANIAQLIDSAIIRSANAPLEVVLNGDVFDLDAPEGSEFTSHDETNATALIDGILNDHPLVVAALERVLVAGHRVVVISGNHDAQLIFAGVRNVVRNYIGSCSFKAWFHRTPDGIHIEHGHQYDALCTFDSPLPKQRRLEKTIGSVASYFMPLLLNRINPHASDPFALREQLLSIVKGSMVGPLTVPEYAATIAKLLREMALVQGAPSSSEALCQIASFETGTPIALLRKHAMLFANKVGIETFVSEERWRTYSKDTAAHIDTVMQNIAKIYGSKGIVFGHTHKAFQSTHGGTFYGNSGFWTPSVDMLSSVHQPGTFIWSDGSSIGVYR